MARQWLSFATALPMVLASAGGSAQETGAQRGAQRAPTSLSCNAPVLSKDAAVYELEGSADIVFDLDDTGRPTNARVLRSSGWRSLDGVALSTVAGCRYAPPSDPGVKRAGIVTTYKVALAPLKDQDRLASFVPGSCAPSERFAGFQPMSGPVREGEGMLVRFVLDAAGATSRVKLEGNISPEAVQAAAAYLGSCRFTPARHNGVPGHGAMYGRLIPKTV